MAYVRTVKTSSGATAVQQIVWSSRRGSRKIEHLGSAHTAGQVEMLKAAARQRIAAGQGELDLGLAAPGSGGPLPITSSRAALLWDSLALVYDRLGFTQAAGGDVVFLQLVAARIIEPTSKEDSLRVLTETGIAPPSYRTIKRRLPLYAKDAFRQALSAVCAAHAALGPGCLVLYDVSVRHEALGVRVGVKDPHRGLPP